MSSAVKLPSSLRKGVISPLLRLTSAALDKLKSLAKGRSQPILPAGEYPSYSCSSTIITAGVPMVPAMDVASRLKLFYMNLTLTDDVSSVNMELLLIWFYTSIGEFFFKGHWLCSRRPVAIPISECKGLFLDYTISDWRVGLKIYGIAWLRLVSPIIGELLTVVVPPNCDSKVDILFF